jgi:hypothetical protein
VRLGQEVQALPRRAGRLRVTGPSTPAELAAAIQELRDQLAWVRDYL